MEKPNIAYHELIDDLAEQKFYGSLTLYFQGGHIDHNERIERNTAKEIGEKMAARKQRKAVHISKKGEANGKAERIQESQAHG